MTIPVPFWEHEDSPVESGSRDGGLTFSRIFVTKYADRFKFLTGLFTGGQAGLPMSYNSNFPSLRANSFDIDRATNNVVGSGVITSPERQWTTHDTVAIITVDYAPIEFNANDPQNGTWATYNMGAMTEYQSHSGRSMKWESSGKNLPANIQPVVPVPAVRHEVTWHQVESSRVPYDLMRSLRGTVNAGGFYIPASRQTIPDGHLLFSESSARTTLGYDGSIRTELTLVYLEKHQTAFTAGGITYGWNHQWNPEENIYDRVVSEFGDPQFPVSDLSQMYA